MAPEVAHDVAATMYERCASGAFQRTLLDSPSDDLVADENSGDSTLVLRITLADYRQIAEFCTTLPDLSIETCRLLLALVVFYRYHYHPSNWVRYDRKNIFYLAGLQKKPLAAQELLTQYLHAHCGLQMRVVGSNQPIVCYDCPWLHDQPAPGESTNPLINLGPMTPTALSAAAAKLKSGASALSDPNEA